jgi:hypothetical protein
MMVIRGHSMQTRRPPVSAPGRREKAHIHTGGVGSLQPDPTLLGAGVARGR